jgi:hypothetical protein
MDTTKTWKHSLLDLSFYIENPNTNLNTLIYKAETSTKDELCNYVLLFGGDIKREVHLWLKNNDFKALLY